MIILDFGCFSRRDHMQSVADCRNVFKSVIEECEMRMVRVLLIDEEAYHFWWLELYLSS